MATHGQRSQHVEGAAEGMSQRQECQVAGALEVQTGVDTVHDVTSQVVGGEHHALAEARSARGVVDFY